MTSESLFDETINTNSSQQETQQNMMSTDEMDKFIFNTVLKRKEVEAKDKEEKEEEPKVKSNQVC